VSQACAATTADMIVKCDAVAADQTDIVSGMACCAAAALIGASECSCAVASDGKLYFAAVATQCNLFGLTVDTPTCAAAAPVVDPPTSQGASAAAPVVDPPTSQGASAVSSSGTQL
jgi:hypothetical protein